MPVVASLGPAAEAFRRVVGGMAVAGDVVAATTALTGTAFGRAGLAAFVTG